MNTPILSVCIPTFNRSAFLDRLLRRLADELPRLPIEVELIVSDNASSDDTPAVCTRAAMEMGERFQFFRQDKNVGSSKNLQFAISKARADYFVYLADDDILLWEPLLDALKALQSNKAAVGLYAPWCIVDLTRNKITGQFYHHPETVTYSSVSRAGHAHFIIKHHVFSEIGIFRTNVWRFIIPAVSDVAYWAFTIPAELLAFGELIYYRTPFYGSVSHHPGLPARSQQGVEETMIGWDRYRGGVEHLIGLARESLDGEEVKELQNMAETMVVGRMLVAIRLRVSQGKNPLETYFLASRVRSYGYADKLPVPFQTIKIQAAISHLTEHVAEVLGATELVLLGYSSDEERMIVRLSAVPVRCFDIMRGLRRDQLVLIKAPSDTKGLGRNLSTAGYTIFEGSLLAKFP